MKRRKIAIAFAGLLIVVGLKIVEEFYINALESQISYWDGLSEDLKYTTLDYVSAANRTEDTILFKDKYDPIVFEGRRASDLNYLLRAVINIDIQTKKMLSYQGNLDSIANAKFEKYYDFEAQNDIRGLELYIQNLNLENNKVGHFAQDRQREKVLELKQQKSKAKLWLTLGQVIGLILAFIEKFIPDKKPIANFEASLVPANHTRSNTQRKSKNKPGTGQKHPS